MGRHGLDCSGSGQGQMVGTLEWSIGHSGSTECLYHLPAVCGYVLPYSLQPYVTDPLPSLNHF